MSRKLKPGSLAEFLVGYEPDPEHAEQYAEGLAHIHDARATYDEAAGDLVRDLRTAGFDVETVGDLRGRGVGNADAVAILLKWLPEISYQPLANDVIHTLASPWASTALRPLIAQFHRVDANTDPQDGVRWAIGDTLDKIADDTVTDELVAIARDTGHGSARGMVVLALGRLRKSRDVVVPVLMDLLDDADVANFAMIALGKLKVAEARPRIEMFTRDADPWVREKARQALAKLPT